jgi:hypothetical protein
MEAMVEMLGGSEGEGEVLKCEMDEVSSPTW